ncbi:MAG TPA: M48 family metalloprotease [Candidatus Sulfotelmatobacter sp.]|nr:M48 family metalloprotease [Candidatus Sulfotelmatobacter sp.]
MELGNKLALTWDKQFRFISDPAITSYVQRVNAAIEQNSDKHLPVTIKLIDAEEVKAFALPGGHLYITRGLLLRLENEGQLASLLARGVARVALRSYTNIATIMDRSPSRRILPGPGVSATGSAQFQELDRDAELDADYFGVQYVYKSGYDPTCFTDFVQRIWGTNPIPKWFRDYPPLPKRLRALQKEIAGIMPTREGAITTTPEFQEFRVALMQ